MYIIYVYIYIYIYIYIYVCMYIYIYVYIPGEYAGSTNSVMVMLLIRKVLSYIFFILLTFLSVMATF